MNMLIDVGTDPASSEAADPLSRGVREESAVEGEPASWRSHSPLKAASAGSEIDRQQAWGVDPPTTRRRG